jgi:Peptidase family M23
MTDLTMNQKTENGTGINEKPSSLTPNSSWKDLVNHQVHKPRLQEWDSNRGDHKHRALDVGEPLTTLGTPIQAVFGGKVTIFRKYFQGPYGRSHRNDGNGGFDYGVVIKGKDSMGRNIEIRYGHLDPKSVNLRDGQVIPAGTILGKVSPNSRADENEYHVHLQAYVEGEKVRPMQLFKEVDSYLNQGSKKKDIIKSQDSQQLGESKATDLSANKRINTVAGINQAITSPLSNSDEGIQSINYERAKAIREKLGKVNIPEDCPEFNSAFIGVVMNLKNLTPNDKQDILKEQGIDGNKIQVNNNELVPS